MENDSLTLAINIDDILLDKNGKLTLDALNIFKNTRGRANYIFLTDSCANVAFSTFKQVGESLGTQVSGWVISNGGARIYAPNGRLVDNKPLDTMHCWRLVSYLRAYDNNCMLMYCTESGNYVDYPKNAINDLRFKYLKFRDSLLNDNSLNPHRLEGMRYRRDMRTITNEIGEICQIVVREFDKNKRSNIAFELRKNSNIVNICEKSGAYFIQARGKLSALQTVLENSKTYSSTSILEKGKFVISTMPDDVSKIVYIGNSASDIDCLNACDISIASRSCKNGRVRMSAKYTVEHVGELVDFILPKAHEPLEISK